MKLVWFMLKPQAIMQICFRRAKQKQVDKSQELGDFVDGLTATVCILGLVLLPIPIYAIRFLGFDISSWVGAAAYVFCLFATMIKAPKSKTMASVYERASAEVDMVAPDRYLQMGFKYLAIIFARTAIAIEAMALICNTLSAHTPGSPLYHQ